MLQMKSVTCMIKRNVPPVKLYVVVTTGKIESDF